MEAAGQGMLLGRVALVTGAGSGIGHGIAAALASRGWRVAVNDLDAEIAGEVAVEVDGIALAGDAYDDSAALVERCVEVCGRLDGLVNNAGKERRAGLEAVRHDEIADVMNLNVEAPLRLMQHALAHLEVTKGAVVNITSVAVDTAPLGSAMFGPSKAALAALTRQAAAEWGPRGVRVNAVAPGFVRTAMAEVVSSGSDVWERRRGIVPLRRTGTPADVGAVVAFLLSDDAAYVTGETVTVDGGLTCVAVEDGLA